MPKGYGVVLGRCVRGRVVGVSRHGWWEQRLRGQKRLLLLILLLLWWLNISESDASWWSNFWRGGSCCDGCQLVPQRTQTAILVRKSCKPFRKRETGYYLHFQHPIRSPVSPFHCLPPLPLCFADHYFFPIRSLRHSSHYR